MVTTFISVSHAGGTFNAPYLRFWSLQSFLRNLGTKNREKLLKNLKVWKGCMNPFRFRKILLENILMINRVCILYSEYIKA